MEFQKILLEKNGFLEEQSLLRANDLWKKVLTRFFPEKKIVRNDILVLFVQDWIEKNFAPEVLKPRSAKTLLQYCHQMSDILFSSDRTGILEEWLDQQENKRNWQFWMKAAKACLRFLVMEKECMSSSWIPSFLVHHLTQAQLHQFWHQPLIVDLGAELLPSEAELLIQFSKFQEVTVLMPILNQSNGDSRLQSQLQVYDMLRAEGIEAPTIENTKPILSSEANILDTAENVGHFQSKDTFYRANTSMTEIQFALHQIKSWLTGPNQVKAHEILVVFADLEQYWSKFSFAASLENITLQKPLITQALQLPSVQEWISRCFVHLGHLQKGLVEATLFGHDACDLPFDEYQTKYFHYEESSDLERIKELQEKMLKKTRDRLVSRKVILSVLEKKWTATDFVLQRKIFGYLFEHTSAIDSLSLTHWHQILDLLLSQLEIVVTPASPSGIAIASLTSATSFLAKKKIFMGLNDESIKSSTSLIPFEDLKQIRSDLSFYLHHSESSAEEFEIYWQNQNDELDLNNHSKIEICYCFSASDFQGSLLSPHRFIIEKTSFPGTEEPVNDILLDHHPLFFNGLRMRDLDQQSIPRIQQRLDQDQGTKINRDVVPSLEVVVSATHLESYQRCPFIYFTQKILKLKDLPELDFDLDPLTEGQIMHGFFEHLMQHLEDNWTAKTLHRLLDQIKTEKRIEAFDEKFWGTFKEKATRIAFRFIEMEKAWKKQYPGNFISALEKTFDVEDVLEIPDKDGPIKVRLRGQIDRVESDKNGHYIIVDYKRNTTKFGSAKKWIEKNTTQLLFYAYVLKKFYLQEDEKVIALQYYDYKKLNRIKGLIFGDFAGKLYPESKSKAKIYTEESFAALMNDFEVNLKATISKIHSQDFDTKPLDVNDCQKCNWRPLCRAPHLNT